MEVRYDNLRTEYLNSLGAVCPFCQSTNLEVGDREYSLNIIWWNVRCGNCSKEWTDQFELVNVQFLDEQNKP